MQPIQVLTTVDTEDKANEIADILLKKRLACCVQIFPISSKYWWQGKIENSKEFACLIKGKNFEKIELAIKEIHPYKTPEILAIPIVKGNRSYLDWLDKETS